MVPEASIARELRNSFPRASGDGPGIHGQRRIWNVFPPRERGWSQSCVRA